MSVQDLQEMPVEEKNEQEETRKGKTGGGGQSKGRRDCSRLR